MAKFLDKNSSSFVVNFFLFLLVSVMLIIGVSTYADAHGLNVSAAVINYLNL